jgi:enamine deaminase RidA (YjgF/YER057c/UK114 family)
MERAMSDSPHEIITAPGLAPPTGYAHAVVAARGRVVFLGGQTALGPDGKIVGRGVVEQFDIAAGNVVSAMKAAGCAPEDLVSLQIFVTDLREYRYRVQELAPVWQKWFGRRYPAIGLFGVTELYDNDAQIELMGVAVRPE